MTTETTNIDHSAQTVQPETVQPETAQTLSNTLVRVMKIMSAMKHQAPRQHAAVDPSHYPVLFCLAANPQRVSGVADTARLPSRPSAVPENPAASRRRRVGFSTR